MSTICNIERDVRIIARDNCFVIQVEENSVWVDKYSYSWIGDAIKGYVLFSLKRSSGVSRWKDVKELSEKIENLDTTMKLVDRKLCKVIKIISNDPIESEFMKGDKDVKSDK